MAIRFDYSRGGRQMSLRGRSSCSIDKRSLAALRFAWRSLLPACAQYPGQVTKTDKDTPELRSIAVLEWTGDAGKPKASRLVPVRCFDGGQLQDGGIYLARPQPLALAGEVEYELQQNGKPIGLYDIRNAGQEQGSWVGYGAWKPHARAQAQPCAPSCTHESTTTTSKATVPSCIARRTPTRRSRQERLQPSPACRPDRPHDLPATRPPHPAQDSTTRQRAAQSAPIPIAPPCTKDHGLRHQRHRLKQLGTSSRLRS